MSSFLSLSVFIHPLHSNIRSDAIRARLAFSQRSDICRRMELNVWAPHQRRSGGDGVLTCKSQSQVQFQFQISISIPVAIPILGINHIIVFSDYLGCCVLPSHLITYIGIHTCPHPLSSALTNKLDPYNHRLYIVCKYPTYLADLCI